MSDKQKNKLIPKLRFPEFKDSREWVEKKLGDKSVSKILMGSSPKSLYYNKQKKGLPLIQGNADIENRLSSPRVYTEQITKECKIDDILLSVRAPVGKVAKSVHNACIGRGIAAIRAVENTSQSFLYQLLLKYEDFWGKISQGAAFDAVNSEDIRNFTVYFPPFQEQQKIASFLSNLDELIEAHKQKLELLKQHKKGMMQNLFPQEGEKVPKLRFPEFKDSGEWEEKKLGNLIEIKGRIGYRGYTRSDIVDKGEGAISMSPSNIDDFGYLNFEKSTYISWEKYEESPEIMLEKGFTVLIKTGSSFGKAAYISNLKEKTTINPQLVVLKPTKINSRFLYLIITNTSIQNKIKETVVGGAIPTLSQDSISKFDVLVPEIKEQQKIASCLSSVDEIITAEAEMIEQLERHKKGLMQGLFPIVNE